MVDKNSSSWNLKDASSGQSAKAIPEHKIKFFEEGNALLGKKGMSKREQEEQRKKQDQQDAAAVYEDFVASFSDTSKHGKTWVKGETVNADKQGRDKGRLYKPTSKLAELASTFDSSKKEKEEHSHKSHHKPSIKKKPDEKKKSNLELFKEELKRIQEEREERHRVKRAMRSGDPGGGGGGGGGGGSSGSGNNYDMGNNNAGGFNPEMEYDNTRYDMEDSPVSLAGIGIYDQTTDESSTNIYVGNINPKMSERQLMELFGRFGPLASVKIMWPRTDEEKSRGRNCGFVAFMNRKDGERGLKHLKGKDITGFEMKLGWGKPVPIPPHPIYIPPALAELTMPPPPSGLPFNCQPKTRRDRSGRIMAFIPPKSKDELQETLVKAVCKVVIPTERNLLSVIHRMVEFVVREGPMFEAMIMNREITNPLFKFLFDNQSPAHIYYRWKLFSILNGDQPYKWRMEEFRMFRGGSYWKPPPMNPYTQGMPEELVDVQDLDITLVHEKKEEPIVDLHKKGKLTDSQRDRLEDMLRELTPERPKVGESMVWCMDHAESAEEVVECIAESLSILQTPIPKKIARLFLISDILFNSSAKIPNASFYRKHFQRKLQEIFRDVHETYENIDGRLKAEQFKQKVMLCFRAWEDWAVYPNDYLINLQNIFLGLVMKEEKKPVSKPELDGFPIMGEPELDGLPIEEVIRMTPRRVERPERVERILHEDKIEDLDGAPFGEDLDGEPLKDEDRDRDMNGKAVAVVAKARETLAKFTKSKWESVDETELEAQAMTTSKWDLLDDNKPENEEDLDGMPIDEDIDGEVMSEEEGYIEDDRDSMGMGTSRHQPEMTEERRRKLREIEVKVVKYQDELEAGKRSRKQNMSFSEQVEHHRKKLLAKEFEDSPSRDSRKRHRSPSPAVRYEEKFRYDDSPKRKRAKSPKKSRRSRSRSRSSPYRRSKSRSPSRQRRKSKKSKHRD